MSLLSLRAGIGVLPLLVGSLLLPGTAPAAVPYAYITEQNADRVTVFNTLSGAVVAQIPVVGSPFPTSVAPDGRHVYVASLFGNTLSIIRTDTHSVIGTVNTGIRPYSVAVSPDSQRVFVANYQTDDLTVIDAQLQTVIATAAVGRNPSGVAFNPRLPRAYISNGGSNTLTILNTDTLTSVGTLPTGVSPWGLAVHPNGNRVYVANWGAASVTVIDANTQTVIGAQQVGSGPLGVAVHPDGSRVYIANMDDDSVSIMDAQTLGVLRTVSVGNSPGGVSLNASGTRAYITNALSRTVSVINTENDTVLSTWPLESAPTSVGSFVANVAAAIPDPPTITNIAVGDRKLQIELGVPQSDGGSPILSYSVQCGEQAATSAGPGMIVNNLVNGTPVSCRAWASNAIGPSLRSAPSAPVTPATVPDPPTILNIVPGDGSLTVYFEPPANDGGSPITNYNVFCTFAASGQTSPIVMNNQTNGVPQTCRMNAINAVGGGAAGAPFGPVTPGVAPTITSTPPPGGQFGVPYQHTITASGAPAPTYSLQSGALPSGLSLSSSGIISGTPSAITSTPATGVIRVSNGIGNDQLQSFAIDISATAPGAPEITLLQAGDGQIQVHFLPPANTGGLNLDNYTATCGAQSSIGAASPLLITGLPNFTPVSCTVRAQNAIGPGPESSPAGPATPAPDAIYASGFE